MKRKFKLFATLASLCLSVALMAFGVYAATNVSYTVTSTVSFDSQVTGQFAWEVVGGTMADESIRTGSETALVGSEIHTEGKYTVATRDLGNVKFDPAENKNEIVYYVSFTNSSDAAAYVTVSFTNLFDLTGSAPAVDQLDVYVGKATNAALADAKSAALTEAASHQYTGAQAASAADQASTSVAAGATYALAVKVVLLNATQQLTAANQTLNVTMSVTSISA